MASVARVGVAVGGVAVSLPAAVVLNVGVQWVLGELVALVAWLIVHGVTRAAVAGSLRQRPSGWGRRGSGLGVSGVDRRSAGRAWGRVRSAEELNVEQGLVPAGPVLVEGGRW